ncbi:MAG: hypothetical protein IKN65_04880 [Clostridia bacterium]|nr:hypothetical protein [Clostridia bacterium]
MELIQNLNNNLSEDININNLQNNFLKSNIGQIANTAIDIGIKSLMPEFIENEVIDVKNAIINGGIKEGINTAIENAINLGKNILGINNSDIKSIGEAKSILENGNLINGISKSMDFVLEGLSDNNIISKNTFNLIKGGKDLILNNISTNVENEFENEIKSLKKIEKYISNWEKYYSEKNMDGLNKEYKKIEKQIKNILPLKNIINNINKIENINELIKNNENFDFSEYYLDLAGSF